MTMIIFTELYLVLCYSAVSPKPVLSTMGTVSINAEFWYDLFQQKLAARAETEEGEEGEEESGGQEEAAELLQAIQDSKEEYNGRIGDQHVIRFFRQKLLSKPCQNQGFILDGFPKTIEQAKELFAGKIISFGQ